MIDTQQTNTPAKAPVSLTRQTLIWTLKIVVSSGLLYIMFRSVDLAQLWHTTRTASLAGLAGAAAIYFAMIFVASWRWWLLARTQHLALTFRSLVASYLVATFFNNFLPSNIGGDVIRIRDMAKAAGSTTLAAMIVLVDRGIGLMGLIFVAAIGSTMAARMSDAIGPTGPGILWTMLAVSMAVSILAVMKPHGVAVLLRPFRALHQEWVEARITRLTTTLARFGDAPRTLGVCFGGAIVVQAVMVVFYAAIAWSLHIQVPLAHLAIVVPISFIVQMLPVSVNGLGVRETTFVVYLTPLGVPRESALALSLISAVLIMLVSTTGAVTYLTRGK